MGVDVPMDITGVRMELPSNTPIILLREQGGERFLPIWIGPVEAMAISAAIDGVAPPRPQTHDLLTSVIDGLGAAVSRVVVTELRDNVFFADLVLEVDGREVVVSARPSDAVALAVRTGSPVFARTDVLDEAGIEIREEEEEAEIERFREALEDMTVEDFLGEDLE
ncbi:MAG TPA: bifunctional nuclease family protein [Acidimicrobiia bacterium]